MALLGEPVSKRHKDEKTEHEIHVLYFLHPEFRLCINQMKKEIGGVGQAMLALRYLLTSRVASIFGYHLTIEPHKLKRTPIQTGLAHQYDDNHQELQTISKWCKHKGTTVWNIWTLWTMRLSCLFASLKGCHHCNK